MQLINVSYGNYKSAQSPRVVVLWCYRVELLLEQTIFGCARPQAAEPTNQTTDEFNFGPPSNYSWN